MSSVHAPQVSSSSYLSPDGGIIPDDRCTVEQRGDNVVVVRVRSAGPERDRLPDAVFSFRCGDPQYSYWLDRVKRRRGGRSGDGETADGPRNDG